MHARFHWLWVVVRVQQGTETPTLCFNVKEVGKIENSPPHVETRDGGLVVRIGDLHLAF